MLMDIYEEYKDSGIDWVGKVPASWKRSRIKFLLSHSSAGVWGEDEKGNKDDIVCFRAADFDYSHGCLKLDNNTVRNIQPKQLEGRVLHKRDLLIEKSGGGDATPVGRIVRFNYDGIATCSNFMHFISVNKNNDDNYLFYYFYAMYANNVNVLYFNQTTGIQNLKVSEYLGQIIFIPSLKEQSSISSYLDKKCSEIDNVISAQQKRIALLQELKQSVITHAVTKGLNPNVEMKDSGVEWIGKIPASWDVVHLKRILRERMQYGANEPAESDDTTYPRYIRITDITANGELRPETFKSLEPSKAKDYLLDKGDVLFARSGATVGKTFLFNADIKACYAGYLIKASCDKRRMLPEYLYYYTQSGAYECWKNSVFIQSTIQNIGADKYQMMYIPVPSKDEQKQIVEYTMRKSQIFDAAISKAQHQVELLQEYKQSLITEVVTGKRKVS